MTPAAPKNASPRSRRRFLGLGLAALGVVSAAIAGLRVIAGRVPEQPQARTLNDRQYAVLDALARLLFPTGAVVRADESRNLARTADAAMARLPEHIVSELRLALMYVEAAPVVLERRAHTFSQLEPAAQEAHWHAYWETTSDDLRRGIGASLRRLLGMWLYDTASVWPHMGYPGPLLSAMELE